MPVKHQAPRYADLRKRWDAEPLPTAPDWTPLKPRPLPAYIQERIDAFRKIPSLIK